MAVGSSGCGKSTAIHYVALQLYHQQGYDIIPVYSPEEVRQYYNHECRQVYIIDDICGKATIDTNLINNWYRQSNEIQKILLDQKVKILSSCRIHIFQDRLFKNLSSLSPKPCDLIKDYKLTCDERKTIASIYLTKDEMKMIENIFSIEVGEKNIQKSFEQFDCFPLLCSIYSTQKLNNILYFFRNPVQVVINDLNLLIDASDQKTIAVLMLLVAYNNTINDNLLSRTSGIKQVLEAISDNFHLQQCFSIQCVKSELDNLNRSYVKKIGHNYTVKHDKLYEILVLFLSEHKFEVLLDLAHTNTIRDMFVLKSSNEAESDSVGHINTFVNVSRDKEDSYFDRLIRDINDGFIKNVLNNKQMKFPYFRNIIIKRFKSLSNTVSVLNNLPKNVSSSLFIAMVRLGSCEMAAILIDHVDSDIAFRDALQTATDTGSTNIVKLLLEHNIDPQCINIINGEQKAPLFEASKKGYIGIVELLLNYGADPDIRLDMDLPYAYIPVIKGKPLTHSKDYESPLHVAIENEHSDIVKVLLHHNADANIDGWDGTPLYLAVMKRNTEVVKSLLIHKANPNHTTDHNKPVLYISAENGDFEIVKLLLDNEANPNFTFHENNKSPLHIAVEKNDIEIVKLLSSHNANPYILDKQNKSPIFTALALGNIDAFLLMTKMLNTVPVDAEHIWAIILYFASFHGRIDILISLLVEKNIDGNNNNYSEYKQTPLYIASEVGNFLVVFILLEHKCDPNIADMFNETPLLIASYMGHTDIVKLLLDAKGDPNISNIYKQTPLHMASGLGHMEIVKLLLENNSYPNTINMDGETSLFIAASKGHAEIVNFLLENGGDPYISNKFNQTPLHEASYQGHSETVKVLLEHNADPAISDKENDSPLYTTLFEGQRRVMDVLFKHNWDSYIRAWYHKTPLCIATKLGYTEIVRLLLKYDTSSKCKNKIFLDNSYLFVFGPFIQTPLLHATFMGYTEILKLYLEHSWDPNIANSDNQTPLYVAAFKNNAEAAKILLDFGCNPNISSRFKITPLFVASANGYTEIVKILLEHNCNTNIVDVHGTTSIYKASENGHVDTVKLLLEYNSDPNICNKLSETPLHVSALTGCVEIVKLLLASKCNPNIFNSKNEQPVDIAKSRGHTDILNLLQNPTTLVK